MAAFTCTAIAPLPRASNGWYPISYAPLLDGSLACFEATTDVKATWRANREFCENGEYERQRPLFVSGDRGRLLVGAAPPVEFPLEHAFPKFDRLADGDWVVVGTRCAPGASNARRLTPRGELVARFAVGDGVEQIQADDGGGFWVSYFDEGVFGDDPLSAAGLARFDASGRPTWAANTCAANTGAAAPPHIGDCYVLNVAGSTAWACYYSDFPILAVGRDGAARVWRNEIDGARAIAVDGDHVVLFGGYAERSRRIALLKLGPAAVEWIGDLHLASGDGREPQAVVGRSDTIHLIGNGVWERLTVGEGLAAVRSAGEATLPRAGGPG